MRGKHTRGPWRVRRETLKALPGLEQFGTMDDITGIDTEWEDGQLHGPCPIVTTTSGVYGTNASILREEDAHLIAAAPDLLEAAKMALEAALQLARCDYYAENDDHVVALRAAIAKAEGKP